MKNTKDPNRYPKGLNRKKVQELIDYYDHQSDADAIADAEASYRRRSTSCIEVPVKLLPAVRQPIARGAPGGVNREPRRTRRDSHARVR